MADLRPAFDPQHHLIKLPRRVKDRDGRYTTVYDDYLEVKWRLCWFRDRYPQGQLETEEICVDLERGYTRYKARVADGEGGTATGYGTETKAEFADYVERAETRALGRALAALGIGTQFVGEDLTEGDHVADAPVAPAPAPAPTNGHPSDAPTREPAGRPTAADITVLTTLAVVECREDPEVFAQRLRTLIRLKPSASVAPKLLTRTMSMTQFMEAMAYYQRLQVQLSRPTEMPDGPVSESRAPDAPETAPTLDSAPTPGDVRTGEDAPTPVSSHSDQASTREGLYATPQQLAALKRLAARVGPEAAEDLQDVLDHVPKGLVPDLYQRIEVRLQARLNGRKTVAVA